MIWTGIVTVCLVCIAIGLMQSARFLALRHVWGRPTLVVEEIAAKFFPMEQRDIASKVLRLLTPYLPVSAGRVHPDDRLIDDLGLSACLSRGLDEVEFVHDLEDEFKIEFGEDDYLHMQTFRDTVEIVAVKISMDQSHLYTAQAVN